MPEKDLRRMFRIHKILILFFLKLEEARGYEIEGNKIMKMNFNQDIPIYHCWDTIEARLLCVEIQKNENKKKMKSNNEIIIRRRK